MMRKNDLLDARKSVGGKQAAFFSEGPGDVPDLDTNEPTQESLSPSLEEMVGKHRFQQDKVKSVEQSLKDYEEQTAPPKLDLSNTPKGKDVQEGYLAQPVAETAAPLPNPATDDKMLAEIEALQPSDVEYNKPQLSMEELHGNLRTEGDNYRVLLHQLGPLVRTPRNSDINTYQEMLKDSHIPQVDRDSVTTILNPAKPTTVEEAESAATLEDKARKHAIVLLRHQYPQLTETEAQDKIDTGSGPKLQQKLRDYYRMQDATNFLKDQEASIIEDKKDAEEFLKIFPGKNDPAVQKTLQDSLGRVQKGLPPRKYLDPAAEELKNHLYPFMKDVKNFDLGAASDTIEKSGLVPMAKQEMLGILSAPINPREEADAQEQALKYLTSTYPMLEESRPNYKKDFLNSWRGDQFVKQIIDSNRLNTAMDLLKSTADPKIKHVLKDVLWSAEKGAMEPRGYGVQSETPSAKPKETNPLYNEPTSGQSLRKRQEEREQAYKESPEGKAEESTKGLIDLLNPRTKKNEEKIRKEQELKDQRIKNVRGMLKEMEPYSIDPAKADTAAISEMINTADMPDYMKRILNRRLQPLDMSKDSEYIFHPTAYRESMLKGLSDAETTMANAFDVKNTRTPKALKEAREFMNNPTPENQARAKQFLDLARIQDVMNIMNNWQLKWTDPALMEFNKIKDVRPDIEPNQPGKPKFPFQAKPSMYRPADARNTSGLIDPYEMDQKKEQKRLNRKQTFENAGKEAYFETYNIPVKDRADYAEWFASPEGKSYLTDVTNTLEKDYQDRAKMYQNMPQRKKQVEELPTEDAQLVDYVGKHFKSMEDLKGAANGKGTPEQQDLAKYILKKMNPKDLASLFTRSSKLNLKKTADTEGPGGADWSYDYTSGDSPTAMPKEKRKDRFPFHNSPGTVKPGEGDQGNMIDNKTQENYYLASIFPKKTKTADNDMFETYLWEGAEDRWISQTVFKRAYTTFKPGDVVVQYGSSSHMYKTFRRRTGSIEAGKLMFRENLLTIADTLVGGPTPDDSLAEGPGGRIMRNTEDSEPGPRDGFERRKPSRQQTERNALPYMDTPDTESVGFGMNSSAATKKANALKIVDDITNKWMDTAQAAGPDTVLNYFADTSVSFNDLIQTITANYGTDAQSANAIARMIMQTVPEMIHVKYAAKDILPGGKGDNKPDSAFNPEQLAEGVKVESEHTPNPQIEKEIAKDHLTEIPDYYTRLNKMEQDALGKKSSLNLQKKALSQTMVILTPKGQSHYDELRTLWNVNRGQNMSAKGHAALVILEIIFGAQSINAPLTNLEDVANETSSTPYTFGVDMAQMVQALATNGFIAEVPVDRRGPEGEPLAEQLPEGTASAVNLKKTAVKPNPYAKSVLNQILEPMRTATEDQFAELKQLALDTVSQSQIAENDKAKMLANISSQTMLASLQKYLYNSLLYFEGMGVLSFRQTAEQMVTQSQTPEDQAWQEQPADSSINFKRPEKSKRPTEQNETGIMNGEYGDRPRMLLSMKDKKRKPGSEKK